MGDQIAVVAVDILAQRLHGTNVFVLIFANTVFANGGLRGCGLLKLTFPWAQGAHQFMDQLKRLIREVPDFPKPGILFYDITTLLQDPTGLRAVIDGLTGRYKNEKIDKVIGVEARGFIFAPAVAYALHAGFVPVRKPKKLPFTTKRIEYSLEYGTDALEIHIDAVKPGERVLIVDDLLATGGTTRAVADLVQSFGAEVAGLGFVVELDFLRGREKLGEYSIQSLVHYAS